MPKWKFNKEKKKKNCYKASAKYSDFEDLVFKT